MNVEDGESLGHELHVPSGSTSSRPRVLVLAGMRPLPADSGGRLRLWHTIRGLAEVAEVDLLSPTPAEEPSTLHRDLVVSGTPSRRPLPARLADNLLSTAPSRVSHQREERSRLLDAVDLDDYDVLWFVDHAFWAAAAGRPRVSPAVFDFYDLESDKARSTLEPVRKELGTDPRALAHGLYRLALLRRDVGRWRRLERTIVAEADLVLACSSGDLSALAADGRGSVVPNGYEIEGEPAGRADREHRPPVLLLAGHMGYPPNTDAARWLVRDILPSVDADAVLHIVGKPGPVTSLQSPGRVAVLGRVADMSTQLAAATVCVVPIRSGSGTRIKILEAFAHGVPVVSTALGAAGLGAQDGQHLLIEDDPRAFAAAVNRVIADPALRVSLTASAHELWRQQFQWSGSRQRVRDVLAEVLRRS